MHRVKIYKINYNIYTYIQKDTVISLRFKTVNHLVHVRVSSEECRYICIYSNVALTLHKMYEGIMYVLVPMQDCVDI